MTDVAMPLANLFGYADEAAMRAIRERASVVHLERGQRLIAASEAGEDLFIVMRGRLVAVGVDRGGRRWTSRAMTAGATVGEVALLTGGRRSADVFAVRRSEVLRLGRADFEAICEAHPRFSLHLARVLAERLSRTEPPPLEGRTDRVIAVVALGAGDAPRDLSHRLSAALSRLGTCARLDAASARVALGLAAIERVGRGDPDDERIGDWLTTNEAAHRFVVLDAGARDTPWLARCVEHADHVLLVAGASSSPERYPVEAGLHDGPDDVAAAAVSLALVHPAPTTLPSGTARWLKGRRLHAHHHLRAGSAADMDRLARHLAGRGVGLVLGGGGALGAAHVGVLDALIAHGIPVDAIGGTSAGGGVGAQIAMGWDADRIRSANLSAWVDQSPFSRPTLPVMSLISRGACDDTARAMFGDAAVEDLWTPFFCISTDLTRGIPRVHRRGPLWLAARATGALPAVLSPVIEDGSVLVDGGVVDNLPVATMKRLFGGTILAIDIASEIDLRADYDYDALPGPLGALWSMARGRSEDRTPPMIPTIPRVLIRTLTVASQRERQRSHALADILFQPPLEGFSSTDFRAFDAIREVARLHAMERLATIDVAAFLGATQGA